MPTKKLKIYFIGIGGIGVSALAKYYLEKGCNVLGSDLAASEITESLETLGAKLFIGQHQSQRITSDIKLVIYSPAVQKNNPELKTARKLQIKSLSYPEALGELTKKYFTITVSGTHGKSTTTAMISLILVKAGLDPTVIIGTKLREFGNSNFRMGHKLATSNWQLATGNKKISQLLTTNSQLPILVIEADEWQASFLNYWPKIIVLTNIEKEHLDYYKNLNNIIRAFKKFISRLPNKGLVIANRDDQGVKRVLHNTFSTIVENVLWYSLRQREAKKIKKILKIPGEHNVSNALAALTVARVLKIPDKISLKALSEFKGSWRRFEIVEAEIRGYQRGKTRKITIISDYAHHPTEIKATLQAVKEKYPKQKIWCIFQPHQYQRTFYLFKDFVKVFKEVLIDKLIITDIYDVAGREETRIKEKISSKKLIEAINKTGAIYLKKEEIISYLKKNLRGGKVVIIMGAGDIYKLAPTP